MNYGLLKKRLLNKGFSTKNIDVIANEDGTFDVYTTDNAFDANFILIVNARYEILKVIYLR